MTVLTPPESDETLKRFYERCRPPGLWKKIRTELALDESGEPSLTRMLVDSLFGILACAGLVIATNALFVKSWDIFFTGFIFTTFFGSLLIKRCGVKTEKNKG